MRSAVCGMQNAECGVGRAFLLSGAARGARRIALGFGAGYSSILLGAIICVSSFRAKTSGEVFFARGIWFRKILKGLWWREWGATECGVQGADCGVGRFGGVGGAEGSGRGLGFRGWASGRDH